MCAETRGLQSTSARSAAGRKWTVPSYSSDSVPNVTVIMSIVRNICIPIPTSENHRTGAHKTGTDRVLVWKKVKCEQYSGWTDYGTLLRKVQSVYG